MIIIIIRCRLLVQKVDIQTLQSPLMSIFGFDQSLDSFVGVQFGP